MNDLRKIDADALRARAGLMPLQATCGPKPQLRWIAIDLLRVDMAYQREIGRRGSDNIIRIAQNFEWSKFTPVAVSESDKGIYFIIDGQHRTTAAALRGIKDVPCSIVKLDRNQQAAAFAAINSVITAMTPMQVHAARLAAGDGPAVELNAICDLAGVTICRYPVPASSMKPGETMAVGAITACLKRYGKDVLISALRCITGTRKGNPGMIRKPTVGALCAVFDAEPDWRTHPRLNAAMQRFDFEKAWTESGQASYAERCSMESKLVDFIGDHLEKTLAELAA